MRAIRCFLILLAVTVGLPLAANEGARALPEALRSQTSEWRPLGAGEMTWFGLRLTYLISPTEPGQGEPMLVRDLAASPPTATALAVPDLLTVRLELRVVAELSTEVQRVITALRAWLGGARGRTLVSPETARIVEVRELDDFEASTAALAQGVHEARATWALIFQSSRALAASATTLVREGGIDIAAEES